jgi:uncharacterized protein (DUF1330 family)
MSALLTSIGTLRPDGGDALQRYASAVIPLIEAARGAVLCRGTLRESLVGGAAPGFLAVIQFPDADGARRMMESAEYRAAVPDRDLAFEEIRTFISDPL